MDKRVKSVFSVAMCVFLAASFIIATGCRKKVSVVTNIAGEIRLRLQSAPSDSLSAGGEALFSPETLRLFYSRRDFRPAWLNEKGLAPVFGSLLRVIEEAADEGLQPSNYHLERLRSLSALTMENERHFGKLSPVLLSDFDLLSSDAFFLLAFHLGCGKVDPETKMPLWSADGSEFDPAALLAEGLEQDAVRKKMKDLAPKHVYYQSLKEKLRGLRGLILEEERVRLQTALPLKEGMTHPAVKTLRRMLQAAGDRTRAGQQGEPVFDSSLKKAVLNFQRRNGLRANGVLDSPTFQELEKALFFLQTKVEANLERWRWLPRRLGRRFVLIDIASFLLQVIEDDKLVMEMKVVVGNQAWQTPVFSAVITHVILNPYWVATSRVVVEEQSQYIQKDPRHLANNGMKLLRGWGEDEEEVDPATVDWPNLTLKNIDFRLRQDPGPLNVLGRIKFEMPNKYLIFLHDTPYREDFKKEERIFSHGCIRAQRPQELSLFLLQGMRWTWERIQEVIEAGEERSLPLLEPVPIHVNYSTAWVGEDGILHFRADVYHRDEKLSLALRQEPPFKKN